MPAVLKHTECPACGHRHHFCYLGGEMTPGQEYDYLCPETAKKARLRPATTPEVVQSAPQGAVALTLAKGSAPALHEIAREVHEIGRGVQGLVARVEGLEQKASASAESVPVAVQAPSRDDAIASAAGGPERLQEVLPKVKDLAAKVGGMQKLSSIVDTLKDTKE